MSLFVSLSILLLVAYIMAVKTLKHFDGEQATQVSKKMKTFFLAFFVAFLCRAFYSVFFMFGWYSSLEDADFWKIESLLLVPLCFDLLPIGAILRLHLQHSYEIDEESEL